MFRYADIVVIIGMMAFLVSYAAGIIVERILCRMKGTRFSLVHIAVALAIGFAGAVGTFFVLYGMFGRG